jgi:hypothetical protein
MELITTREKLLSVLKPCFTQHIHPMLLRAFGNPQTIVGGAYLSKHYTETERSYMILIGDLSTTITEYLGTIIHETIHDVLDQLEDELTSESFDTIDNILMKEKLNQSSKYYMKNFRFVVNERFCIPELWIGRREELKRIN